MEFIKKILDSIEFYILAGIFFIVIWIFVLSPRNIDGISMYPYLHNFDYILMYKLEYISGGPQRGDVVVFKHSATEDYIKRVIALPGESLLIQDGKVFVNGSQLDETQYLNPTITTKAGATIREGVPYKVPENNFVLIGDNRPASTDSRDFGAVPLTAIEGRAVFVWFPLQNIKVIPRINYKISVNSLENLTSIHIG
jgi:signal peptidase I